MNRFVTFLLICLLACAIASAVFCGCVMGSVLTRDSLAPELSRDESYYVAGLHKDPTLVFTVTDAHGVELRQLPTSLRMGGAAVKKSDMLSFDSGSGEWKIRALLMPQ